MTGNAFVAIADGSLKHPVAIEHPRPHAVLDLLGVLLTLMLADAGKKVLDKLAIGILAEFNRRAFQDTARAADLGAQPDMGFQTARKAAYVIDCVSAWNIDPLGGGIGVQN